MSRRHRPRRRRLKPPKQKDLPAYHQLWRLVDGEVRNTFKTHPDYLPSAERELAIRNSINKRVVGRILSWASNGPGSIP